jgi:hypothetical protein
MKKIMAITETRAAFWTAAVLRRFFDGSPKIKFPKTPVSPFSSKQSFLFPPCLSTAHEPTWLLRAESPQFDSLG